MPVITTPPAPSMTPGASTHYFPRRAATFRPMQYTCEPPSYTGTPSRPPPRAEVKTNSVQHPMASHAAAQCAHHSWPHTTPSGPRGWSEDLSEGWGSGLGAWGPSQVSRHLPVPRLLTQPPAAPHCQTSGMSPGWLPGGASPASAAPARLLELTAGASMAEKVAGSEWGWHPGCPHTRPGGYPTLTAVHGKGPAPAALLACKGVTTASGLPGPPVAAPSMTHTYTRVPT